VLTHDRPAAPPKQDENLTFTFVSEGAASAVEQAKAAAGDQVVQRNSFAIPTRQE